MANILDRLQTLSVRDAMSTGAIQVRHSDSLAKAAAVLAKMSISGAPVTDADGRCVGMLTASDIVRRYAEDQRVGPGDNGSAPESVAGNMSSEVQSMAGDAPLLAAARKMCNDHIHRLPVLDEDGKVAGIITALDVVAAVVNAADEQREQNPR